MRLSRRLSELSSLHFDLLAALRLCERFEKAIHSERLDPEIISSLSIAAIIRYGRTFGSGVRPALPVAMIQALPKALQKAHRRFKTLRDKWAAHSVNDMEETRIVFEAAKGADGRLRIVGVYEEYQILAAASPSDMKLLAQLCRALNKQLGKAIIDERSRVLEAAQKLSGTEIDALRSARWATLGRKPERARSPW